MIMTVEDCREWLATHPTYDVPLKQKNITLGFDPAKGFDATKEKNWNKDIDFAKAAHLQGILPDNNTRPEIEKALRISEQIGQPYRADVRNDLSIPLKEKYGD